jgi:hypothetical protein
MLGVTAWQDGKYCQFGMLRCAKWQYLQGLMLLGDALQGRSEAPGYYLAPFQGFKKLLKQAPENVTPRPH